MVTRCQHCGAQLALGAVACFRCGRMVDAESKGGTTGGGQLPTELQTLAKAGLLENQWRLLKPIGQGKAGTVWEAQDVALDRRVAVKVLNESLASSPPQVTRFEREVRVLAKLEHPNLTPVLGSGRFEGRPFVVMRLLTGRTVAELLHARGGKLSLAEVSFCLLPVCDALQALHDVQVVHRDLKPSNVFIGDDRRVTLLDLGQAFEAGSELTGSGELIGAAEYLAPEQIAGKGVDARSDVYALGCLMHELFTGHPPFVGELAQVLAAHATAARPLASSLPEAAGALVVKMLSIDPSARPPLAEVRGLLQQYAPPEIELPPMVLPERAHVDADATPHEGVASVTRPMPALQRHAESPTRPVEADSGPAVAPLAEATRVVPVPVAPLAPERTELSPALARGVREQVTRPTERPLTKPVMLAMAVVAVVLLLTVLAGVTQAPPLPPAPARVDKPQVAVKVNVQAPPPTAPPGPPVAAVTTGEPPPPLPMLEVRRETVNAAAPVQNAPRRTRDPNRSRVQKGFVRVIATLGSKVDLTCRLSIDGKYVGQTPYTSDVVLKGEHALKVQCAGWPEEDLIWPFPSPEKQKQGMLIEIAVGGVEATRPMRDREGGEEDEAVRAEVHSANDPQ